MRPISLVIAALILASAVLVAINYPDIQRYLKIRSM